MSKQDRQGVRTASDLERKYDFGNTLTELESTILQHGAQIESHSSKLNSVDNSVDSMGNNLSSLTRSINTLRTSLSMLQGKLDTLDKAITRMGDSFSTGELNVEGNATIGAVTVGDVEAQNIKVNGDLITAKPVAPRNLLDNSDFTNPVNQRGQTSYTGNGAHGIDRWKVWNSETMNIKNISYGKGVEAKGSIYQYHEANNFDVTKTYTLAACYYGENGETIKVLSKTIDEPFSMDDALKMGLGIDQNNGYVTVGFGGEIYAWVALYEGSYTAETLPPYVPKGYAAELAECMRYFQVIPFTITKRTGNYDETYYFNAMRTTPTAKIYSINGVADKASYYTGDWADMDVITTVWNEPFGGSIRLYASEHQNCNFGFSRITLSADL